MRSTAAWLVVLAMACGGWQPKAPGEPALDTLQVSGALVGQSGRLKVNLVSAPAADVIVTLSVGDAAIAAVPASVTVPAGARGLEIDYQAKALGTTVVSAQLDSVRLNTTLTVASSLVLNGSGSLRLQQGAASVVYAYFNVSLPQPLSVTVSSSNAAVASAPATATTAAYGSSVYVPVKAGVPGAANLTLTYEGSSQVIPVYVTETAGVSSVYFTPTSRLLVGGATRLEVYLSAVPAADVPLKVTSSNPAVAVAPPPTALRAGSSYTYLPITALSAGTTTFTLEAAGATRVATLFVAAVNGVGTLSCSGAPAVGSSTECSLTLLASASSDTVVTLSSSAPSIIEVPASVTVPTGADTAYFAAAAQGPGAAVVTATAGGSSRTIIIATHPGSGVFSSFGATGPLVVGRPATFGVSLTQAFPAGTVMTFGSSNPAVIPMPASLTLAPNVTYVTVSAPVLAVGSTALWAQVGTSRATHQVVVTSATDFSCALDGAQWEVGVNDDLRVSSTHYLDTDETVTVTSTALGVVDVPTSAVFRAGTAALRIPVRATAAGTTALRVTVGQETFGFTLRVVTAAKPLSVSGSGISMTQPGNLTVVLDSVVAKDTVVTLAQAGPGSMSMPASVVVPTGEMVISLGVTGAAAGVSTVTATCGSSSVSGAVTINPG